MLGSSQIVLSVMSMKRSRRHAEAVGGHIAMAKAAAMRFVSFKQASSTRGRPGLRRRPASSTALAHSFAYS